MVAKNRGLDVKLFHSADTVLEWLLKTNESNQPKNPAYRQFLTPIRKRWSLGRTLTGSMGSLLIIGVTTEQKVLLVEQYRIPVHTIEFPPVSSEMNRVAG